MLVLMSGTVLFKIYSVPVPAQRTKFNKLKRLQKIDGMPTITVYYISYTGTELN